MKIGIQTTIREPYKKQFELSMDRKLIDFLKYAFGKKVEIILIYDTAQIKKLDLVVLAGGNDLFAKNLTNKLRYDLTKKTLIKSIKLKKKIFGICYGAQMIAKVYKSKLIKKNFKKKFHDLILNNKKRKIKVNSYHNYEIEKLSDKFIVIAKNDNGFVECFYSNKMKIFSMMWHPERYRSFKKIDKFLIDKYL